MITRKEFTIALIAFSLASAIFAVMPVSSLGTYDPWLDYNSDGKVDLKDVYPMHQAYGTSGDSTKNVNVTASVPLEIKRKTDDGYFLSVISPWSVYEKDIDTRGYDRVSIWVYTNQTAYYRATWFTSDGPEYVFDGISDLNGVVLREYQVWGRQLRISIENPSITGSIQCALQYYAT
jgi:hypothetical protein